MVAAQQPATRNRDEPGIQIARDCDVVQPPAAAPDPDRVCAAMASSSSGVFRERRHIGAVTWQPRNDKRPTMGGGALAVRQSYGSTASCSPIQMDVKPVGADSRRFPLSDPYPLLITATRARMTGCAARCRVARHREARYHRNLHQDEFGPTRAERMQARAGDAPSNPRSSAPIIGIRNSLQIPCSSLKNPC
jgi:hypothetical protein